MGTYLWTRKENMISDGGLDGRKRKKVTKERFPFLGKGLLLNPLSMSKSWNPSSETSWTVIFFACDRQA